MLVFPNAKINLGLHVTERRTDGFHNIETIFYPLPLCDALEIVPAEKDSFTLTGLALPAPAADNLVLKALRLLRTTHDVPPLAVYLRKAIPSGAGLGGGSADAAFMLKLVNDFAALGLTPDELEALAQTLGADCPFFIRNRPVFASGTGNTFTPIPLSLQGYHFCLVKPDVSVSTAQAYAMVTPRHPCVSLQTLATLPVETWRERMTNDFEAPIIARHPIIGEMKQRLYASGAVYAAMSGSGSAVFGIFPSPVGKETIIPQVACGGW